MIRIVGKGNGTLFWHDTRYGHASLAIKFPHLFAKALRETTLTVAQIWNKGNMLIPLSGGASRLCGLYKRLRM